jgi:hypothetical protein
MQPDGTFGVSENRDQHLGWGQPQYVIAGNFAGNGRTDLVVLTSSGYEEFVQNNDVRSYDPLLLLKSNGDGTYAAPVPIALGGLFNLQSVNSADWNSDGFPDLVVGVLTNVYRYYVFLNDGHGSFCEAPDTPIAVSDPQPDNQGDQPKSPFTGTALFDLLGTGQPQIIHLGPQIASTDDYNLEVIGKDQFVGYTPQMEMPLGLNGGVLTFPIQTYFADLNGDGKPDIITRNSGYYLAAPNVSVMLSTSTGYATGFQVQDSMQNGGNFGEVEASSPVAVGVGDFSGSGHRDIASVFGSGTVGIFQNDGQGNFTEQALLPLAQKVSAAAFADLNDDGIPDVVMIIATGAPQVPFATWTFLADGHGGFTRATSAPIPIPCEDQAAPTSITLADVDGDGNLDTVLGTNQFGEIRILINDGSGKMRPPAQPFPFLGSGGGGGQVFADFNNSGHVGFATMTTGGVDVYVGQSDGTFKHTASLPLDYPHASFIKVGDLNNDGISDLVIGLTNDALAVFLGNGDGTFRQAPTFIDQATGYNVMNATLADVNNDGNLDAVATLGQGGGPGAMCLFFGDGKGNLHFNANTVVPMRNSLYYFDPALGDFNGDHIPDLLVPATNSGTFSVTDYLGKGNGTFNPGPVVFSGAGAGYNKVLTGDLNGDGKLDFVDYSIPHGPTLSTYLGDGHGGFTQASTLDVSMGSDDVGNPILPADIALGDFNGDGKLDLAVSYSDFFANPDMVKLYEGDGAANFGAPQTITVGVNPASLVSIPRAPFLDAGTFAVTDHAPVATDDQALMLAGSSTTIAVLANDTHPDHAPLTVVEATAPAHGVVHITDNSTTITYTPAAGFQGTDTFTYTIADPAGVESMATVTLTVRAISITPTSLPDAQAGVGYSQQLTASGGTAPYSFSLTTGALPDGLALSTSGTISGRPTAVGSFAFTVQAQDATSGSPLDGSQRLTIDVAAPAITIGPTVLNDAKVGVSYSQALAPGGGTAPYTNFTVSVGALPAGLALSSGGVLSGTPRDGGSFRFTVQAQDSTTGGSGPYTGSQTFEIVVASLAISPAALLGATVGTTYGQQLTASGGQAPYSFTVTTGGLPPGMDLSGSGLLSGTPNAAGTVQFTVTANDVTGLGGRQDYTLSVDPAPTAPVILVNPSSITANTGTSITFTASASGLPSPAVHWQVSKDGGNSFNPIAGANSTSYAFVAQLGDDGNQYRAYFSNVAGNATTRSATLTVQYGPIITTNPSNLEVVPGSTATFTAAAIGDPAPAGVQWQVSTDGGHSFQMINGATSATLSFLTSISEDGSQYRAVFTNAIGSTPSVAATLRVPSVLVGQLPATSLPSFPVSWSDQTIPTGVGELFDVLVSMDGGAWTSWLAQTSQRSASYTGLLNHRYAFYTQADGAGGAPPPFPEAQTITPLWQRALPPEPENTTTGSGVAIRSLLQQSFSDADPNTYPAIAVSQAIGNGNWQFNNGNGWANLGDVTPASTRLLPQGYSLRFLPAPGWTGEADLLFAGWDRSLGTPGGWAPMVAVGGGTPFSGNAGEASIQVTSTGSAPEWTAGVLSLVPVMPGGSPSAGTVATTFGPLFTGGSGTVGIAVTGVTGSGSGTWQYSRDGQTWLPFGSVSPGSARLLSGNDLIRFVPHSSFTGMVTLTTRAWDGAGSGTDGGTANLAAVSATGGNTHFGGNLLIASLTVNHAPVLTTFTGLALAPIMENTTGSISRVTQFFAGITDPDPDARRGIAIVDLAGPGNWQFSLDGKSWKPVVGVSQAVALLLPASALLRFVPNVDQVGSAGVTYRAWDRTAGVAGSLFSVSTTGGAASASAAAATATVAITPAPTGPTWLNTTTMLTPVLPFPSQSSGDSIAAMFGALFADTNTTDQVGIAIVGLTGTARGIWQFELAGSSTWTTITAAARSTALLLSGGDRLRFVPSKGVLGIMQLQALAWDGTGTHGTIVNVSGHGKIGAGTDFSATLATALVLVNTAPVLRA